ncbi:MAG: hypothetical protein LBE35_02970 [Clostridiales bacterium]|jgi:hypothetical protein|nr:hypothetical protein [Clostridiales bacterium]
MNILFSALSIVVMAAILIASMYLRHKNRRRTLEIGFPHNGRNCILKVKLVRIAKFNFITKSFIPERLEALNLPISCELHDDKIHITFEFEDMPSARTFSKSLTEQGFEAAQISQNRNRVILIAKFD